MDYDCDHDEVPPFALSESESSQHYFSEETNAILSPSAASSQTPGFQKALPGKSGSSSLYTSSSPGLTESTVTDTSSSGSDSSAVLGAVCASHMGTSSSYLLSSLPSISSAAGPASPFLQDSELSAPPQGRTAEHVRTENRASHGSTTFSQLMREIDVDDIPLGKSRMPVVPEDCTIELSSTEGTLISPPLALPSSNGLHRSRQRTQWLSGALSGKVSRSSDMREPLLSCVLPEDKPLLPASTSEDKLERARASVLSTLEGDDSFGVSTELTMPCTVDKVLNIIANPELLWMWCDPIQSLVVTRTSDHPSSSESDAPHTRRENAREYEAQWIEATTTALEPPPYGMGIIHRAGQVVLDALGFVSYGKITMFVERGRRQVGLKIGPFSGGIYATHHIRVCESSGKIRIIDRVCLSRNVEATPWTWMVVSGILDSCRLSSCLFPSLKAYMDQVSTSMARLRVLVESLESSWEAEAEIVST